MSVQPDVRPLTLDVYRRLPEVYRDVDPPTGYALLRWLSLVLDQAGRVDELLADFDPDDGSLPSLVDGSRADEEWLPWLAQVFGLQQDGGPVALRARLADPARAWQHGSTTLLKRLVHDVVGDDVEVIVTSEYGRPGFGNQDTTFGRPGATFGDLGGYLRPEHAWPWTIAVWAASSGDALSGADLDAATGQTWAGWSTFQTWSDFSVAALHRVVDHEVPAGWMVRVVGSRPVATVPLRP